MDFTNKCGYLTRNAGWRELVKLGIVCFTYALLSITNILESGGDV